MLGANPGLWCIWILVTEISGGVGMFPEGTQQGEREKERQGCSGWRNENIYPETEQDRSCQSISFLQEAQQQLSDVLLIYSAQLFRVLECSLLLSHSCSMARKGLLGLICISAAKEVEHGAQSSAVCAAASSRLFIPGIQLWNGW